MIRKYEKYTEIELGGGTVKLCPGIIPTNGVKTLSFATCEQNEIGKQFLDDVGKHPQDIGAEVTIIFASDRDIFNLIRVLTEMAL